MESAREEERRTMADVMGLGGEEIVGKHGSRSGREKWQRWVGVLGG